ncbi:MAG: hypothetical protein IJG63_08435, partial [Oscillospiraceae bacterium]|nr:hypothetical protein [Oscillospiraceae bacterium]
MSLKRTELAALALVLAAAAFVSGYMLGKDNVNIEISTAGSQSIGVDSHSEASDDGTLKSLPGDSGPSTLPADGGL